MEAIGNFFTSMWDNFVAAMEGLDGFMGTAAEAVSSFFAPIFAFFGSIFSWIGSAADTVTVGLDKLGPMWSFFSDAAGKFSEFDYDKVLNVWNWIIGAIAWIFNAFASVVDFFTKVADVLLKVINFILPAIEWITNLLGGLAG